jgi:hypothetical protein
VTATSAWTPQAAPASTARRILNGPRLAWLHLRSRRVPAGILALAICGGLLHAALRFNWTFNSGRYAQLVPMTAHSPFGEAERPTGRWLPYLRLGTAAGMCAAAVGLLQLGVVGMSLNEGVLVLARNVIGFTGLGLLCSLATGGLLAWTLPVGYMAFCQYALLASWTAPWTWPGRPPGDRGAWICACLCLAAGLLLYTIRGPRTRPNDDYA